MADLPQQAAPAAAADPHRLLLRLSDEELAAIMDAAGPLPYRVRDAFLQEVAGELSRCNGDIGPGTVFRVVREQQKKFFDAPTLDHGHSAGKYR